MRFARWAALAIALLAPVPTQAVGFTLSAGAGYVTSPSALKLALEFSPFFEVSILRLELPLEWQLAPGGAVSVRPGLKAFLNPAWGIYARAGYGFQDVTRGPTTQSLIAGAGWEVMLLESLGAFVETTLEPQVVPGSSLTVMFRAGVLGLW